MHVLLRSTAVSCVYHHQLSLECGVHDSTLWRKNDKRRRRRSERGPRRNGPDEGGEFVELGHFFQRERERERERWTRSSSCPIPVFTIPHSFVHTSDVSGWAGIDCVMEKMSLCERNPSCQRDLCGKCLLPPLELVCMATA